MKLFDALSRTGQRRRLGLVGRAALARYGVANARLHFLSDTENAVFRVDSAGKRYALRIHRPQSKPPAEILAELHWLTALRQATGLSVPEPISTLDGQLLHELHLPGVPGPRQVVLFSWVEGHLLGQRITPMLARRLGLLMARLHAHAADFRLPTGCTRDTSDWYGMGRWPAEDVGALLSPAQHERCAETAARVAATIATVSTARDFGLIHSDLHFRNCLVREGELGVIDFDDCLFAPFTNDIAITMSSMDQSPNYAALREAFSIGYTDLRPLPLGHAAEVEAFMVERGLRMVRWIAGWPSVNYFSFGQAMLDAALERCRRYLQEG